MEILEITGEEGMELDGSAAISAVINTSQDGTTNITNITFLPYYQHSLYVAASYILSYFLIFLLCMVGNILVCFIVLQNRHMRTVINLFILNLAISDLLVGIFCIPTTLVDNLISGWPFSNTVCKMSGFVQGVSVSSSVFTLVAIAVERFRCILYPLQPKLTVPLTKAAIMLIWLLAAVIMCPAAMALTVDKVPFHYRVYKNDFNQTYPLYTCYENFARPRMRKVYTAVLFVHIYLLPLTIITLMYGSIGVKLCSSVVANIEPQLANATIEVGDRRARLQIITQKKIKVIKMLIVVTLLFMLSWLPLWTFMMMTYYADLDGDQLDLLTSYIFPFSHWLAFSNSSVNPIIYGYYNENFKRGFQALCRSRPLCCLLRCRPWKRRNGFGRKDRSVQAPCRSIDIRESARNNHLILGVRNRVHNTTEAAGGNRGAKGGCVGVPSERKISDGGLEMAVIHKKDTNDRESERSSSLPVSVCKAWDK